MIGSKIYNRYQLTKEHNQAVKEQLEYLKTLPLKKCEYLVQSNIPTFVHNPECSSLMHPAKRVCCYYDIENFILNMIKDNLEKADFLYDSQFIQYLMDKNKIVLIDIEQIFRNKEYVSANCSGILPLLQELKLIDLDKLHPAVEDVYKYFLQLTDTDKEIFIQRVSDLSRSERKSSPFFEEPKPIV